MDPPGAAWVERGVAHGGQLVRARLGPGGQEGKRDDRAGQGHGQAGQLCDSESVDERGAGGGGKTLAGGAAEPAGGGEGIAEVVAGRGCGGGQPAHHAGHLCRVTAGQDTAEHGHPECGTQFDGGVIGR